MGGLWDTARELATQPNGLLVASLMANVALAWVVRALWRRNQTVQDRIWEVLRLANQSIQALEKRPSTRRRKA